MFPKHLLSGIMVDGQDENDPMGPQALSAQSYSVLSAAPNEKNHDNVTIGIQVDDGTFQTKSKHSTTQYYNIDLDIASTHRGT
ncbi:hypothetical protein Hypma_010446 [Hypsizygus marmoreus]|uniref:Uncharacterized protein n=1 Tax=Hypsizygus marmoreus TaxID=39966 RepID=A0A369K9G0_HYPMA|nr:hypothetical protein Hypma_010446 [Hypsizygus marmoreus]